MSSSLLRYVLSVEEMRWHTSAGVMNPLVLNLCGFIDLTVLINATDLFSEKKIYIYVCTWTENVANNFRSFTDLLNTEPIPLHTHLIFTGCLHGDPKVQGMWSFVILLGHSVRSH